MNTNTGALRGCGLWTALRNRRNPLNRGSDRFQTSLLIVLVLVALAALPFAAAFGSETYVAQKKLSEAQLGSRTQTTATLLADGPPLDTSGRGTVTGNPAPTEAAWLLPDGSSRGGLVPADQGTLAGAKVPIWVDRDGNPVDPPLASTAAAINAAGVGIGLWAAVCAALAAAYLLVRHGLNRFRYAQWDQEWDREQQRWTST